MEAFDFAVGLRPVGAGFLDLRAGAFAGFVPGAAAVAAAVVGDDPFAGDAEFAEPGVGARPELCGCFAAFVVEVLAVGQAGAVVEGGVQVAVAGFGARRGRLAAPVDAPAAAEGDGGQLLDVHVDEFTRAFALITHRRRFGGAVAAVQAPEARLGEDLLHRRRRHADFVGDPGGAAAPTATQADHLGAHLRRTAPRRPVRATGAVHQTARAFGDEAVAPGLGRRLPAEQRESGTVVYTTRHRGLATSTPTGEGVWGCSSRGRRSAAWGIATAASSRSCRSARTPRRCPTTPTSPSQRSPP